LPFRDLSQAKDQEYFTDGIAELITNSLMKIKELRVLPFSSTFALKNQSLEAREIGRREALRSIRAAGEKDWRAHAEWLRLSFPEDYRARPDHITQAVQLNQTTHGSITVERQKALQERHRRALENGSDSSKNS